ncbi:MAG: DinB family protein [bacterium]|jgi:hypothetical protein|nr:DinB family protein [bacterium]
MIEVAREALWRQFGAAIDMLGNAIRACPVEHWGRVGDWSAPWVLAHHTVFWLDFYLAPSREGYQPPAPFGLEELDPAGVLPARVSRQEDLLDWLGSARDRCRAELADMTESEAGRLCDQRPGMSRFELHIYNLRHVQHGAAQLNLLLRQRVDDAPRWVARA